MTIGCAVLAAGGARRFGAAKQLAPFAGAPLVRRVADAACRSACARVAVVTGGYALTDALAGLPIEPVANPGWQTGMASSIRAAVAWARASTLDALLIALADQPRLDPAHLDRLIAAAQGGHRLAASAYAGVLGVPALFPGRFFAALAALSGDRGARALLRDPAAAAVPVDWSAGADDVDRPADLARVAAAGAAD